MQNQQQGQDNVYGLNVNRVGEMSKLAKTILNLHILFVLAYFISGVLSIVRGLTRTETPTYGGEGGAAGGGMGQDSTLNDILNGVLGIGGAILMFFVVRMAIQGDNRDCIMFALFCDSCCAACNCCMVILMMLAIAGLMLGKAVLNVELCECVNADFTTQCDYANTQADACSDCFDKPKCIQDIQAFHDSFGGFFAMVIVYSILVIAQMVCCIVAAVNLSKASNKMRSFPFCVAAPMMQPGMQQGVIVGQPVQGMVVGVAK